MEYVVKFRTANDVIEAVYDNEADANRVFDAVSVTMTDIVPAVILVTREPYDGGVTENVLRSTLA